MEMRTSKLQKNPVDEIMMQTLGMLQVPWGRSGRKKDVAQGMVQPHNPKAMYNGKPIPLDYAWWMWHGHTMTMRRMNLTFRLKMELGSSAELGSRMLWNTADILLEMPTPES